MRELDSGKGTGEVARMYQVSPNRLEAWRGELAFPGHAARAQSSLDAERIPELERKIGQLTMENDFLKKPCGVSGSNPCQPSAMAPWAVRGNPKRGRSGESTHLLIAIA
jgi:hypothetical protein